MQNRPRVLIIDDDPMFRSVVVSLLRKDYLVSVANNGQEGYVKAKKHKPDVAVIDVQMPGWSGLETLTSFRENSTLRDVKVIMLTGDNSKATVIAAIKAGANDYVIKESFKKSEFLEKIQKLLYGGQLPPAPQPAPAKTVSSNTMTAIVEQPEQIQQPEEANVALETGSNPEMETIMEDWE